MSPPRLNHLALRAGRSPWKPEGDCPAPESAVAAAAMSDAPDAGAMQPGLSRRRFFGLTGASAGGVLAATAAPAARAFGAAPYEGFDFRHASGRVAFGLEGQERWVIDAARFAGRPSLSVTRLPESLTVTLSGARWPGTDLGADLAAAVWREAGRWRLRLTWRAIGWEAETDLVDWLAGAAEARGRASLGTGLGRPVGLGGAARHAHGVLRDATDSGTPPAAALIGAATAILTPGWTLRLAGSGVGWANLLGSPVASDLAVLALAAPGTPSLMTPPPPRRSLLTLARGDRAWGQRPEPELPAGARLDCRAEPFDLLHLELAEDEAGRHSSLLMAEGRRGEDGLDANPARFEPGPAARDLAGEAFALPLALLRLVDLADGRGGQERRLIGRMGEGTRWLAAPGGAAFGLGDPAGAPALEILLAGDPGGFAGSPAERVGSPLEGAGMAEPGGEALVCRPALGQLVLPLAGALTRTRLVPGARAAFAWPEETARGALGGLVAGVIEDALGGLAGSPEKSPAAALPAGPRLLATDPRAEAEPIVAEIHIHRERIDTLTQTRGLTLDLDRPDDLMALDFDFDNLLLRPGENRGDPQRLVLADAGRPARIVIHFPPQHITERASLDEGQDPLVAPTPPVPAALASPSRLAFQVPNANFPNGIPYTLAALLDWSKFEPVAGPVGVVRRPTAFETALVVPWRLILSPDVEESPAWAHARGPVQIDGRSELWHTRLGVEGSDGRQEVAGEDQVDERERPHLRAVWTESFDPDEALFLGCNHSLLSDPFAPMSLTPSDRRDITMLSGTGDDRIDAERLFLSPLGAWLDLAFSRSAGNTNCPTPLESWIHRAAMGRDFFVRLVYRGNLMPFGHRAALIKITERKFETNAAGDVVAALWQRQFIVVRQPLKSFNDRRLPFRSIRILTLATPNLRLSSPLAKLGSLTADSNGGFWPVVLVNNADQDFPFQIVATDWDGNRVELTMPLAWKAETASAATARDAYNAEAGARVRRPLGGQKVAYAAASSGGGGGEGGGAATSQGDTSLETLALTFAVDALGSPSNPFAPHMRRAEAIVEPLKELLGERTPVDLVFEDTYLQHGFAAAQNAAEIFLKLEDKLPMDFGGGGQGDRGGGLVTPNFDISGLSRKLGLAGGDLANLAGGTFDPADFLDVSNLAGKAKILGYNILDKLLAVIPPAQFGDGERVPRITSRVDIPQQLSITEVYWSPAITPFPPFVFDQGGETDFVIVSTIRAKLDAGAGASAETDILCELTFFALDLVAIKLSFDSLKFTAGSGKSTSLVPVISDVAFGGPLQFVEKLKEVLSSDVLGVGPKIDVTPTGILAGISVGLPSVAVGVFSLENIRLSAALNVPLTGDPVRFRFAFCERESPFILTVSAFGGGGYLAVHLGADGLAKLEMALEFGASLSMSIGVASGSVGVMAGIYLELTSEGGQTDVLLTGYLRCWGELSILGLISISAEFYLAFTYDSARKSCRGQAKLTVKIEILFFEKTFTLSVEREFGGKGGGGFALMAAEGPDGALRLAEAPPGGLRFVDLFAQPDWAAYCDAFA